MQTGSPARPCTGKEDGLPSPTALCQSVKESPCTCLGLPVQTEPCERRVRASRELTQDIRCFKTFPSAVLSDSVSNLSAQVLLFFKTGFLWVALAVLELAL